MDGNDTRKDVVAKAKSMSRWSWDNYLLPVRRKTAGDIKQARTLGARKAARIVTGRNGKAVADAIAKLASLGLKVTKAAVARETGLSDRTVAKYWLNTTKKGFGVTDNSTINRASAHPPPKIDCPIDKKPVFLPARTGSSSACLSEPNLNFSSGFLFSRPLRRVRTWSDIPDEPEYTAFPLTVPVSWHRSTGPP